MRRVCSAVAGAALTGLALTAVGCGSQSTQIAEEKSIDVTAESTSAGQTSSDKSDEINGAAGAPDRVAVYRPGVVDTSLTVDDVPVWPGPDPSEFLEPTLPSGESGELAGEEAEAVYEAALDYPGAMREAGNPPNLGHPVALWNVGGTLEWLVVDQLP